MELSIGILLLIWLNNRKRMLMAGERFDIKI